MYPTIGAIIYLVFCLLVGVAAGRTMYRSLWGWTLLAFLFTPWAAFVFLQVAGPPLRAAKKVSNVDEANRQRKIADVEHRAESNCPSCGSPINLVTRKGIQSPEDEPWRVSCTSCDQEINVDQL